MVRLSELIFSDYDSVVEQGRMLTNTASMAWEDTKDTITLVKRKPNTMHAINMTVSMLSKEKTTALTNKKCTSKEETKRMNKSIYC